MATFKSFTDLEQSKKLAEILPLESADMHSEAIDINDDMVFIVVSGLGDKTKPNYGSPVWSLAALLGVLPNGKFVSTTLSRGGWKIEPVEYIDNWWCEYEDDSHTKDFSVSAGNPIDACVEMIIISIKIVLLLGSSPSDLRTGGSRADFT